VSTSPSLSVTALAAVQTGDLLAVWTGNGGGIASSAVTDSLGNSYAPQVQNSGAAGGVSIEIWTVKSGFAGTPTVTVSMASTCVFKYGIVDAFRSSAGIPNATTDKTASSLTMGSTASAITSPDVTPTVANEVVLTGCAANSGTPGANSPFTLIAQLGVEGVGAAYVVQTAAAAVHADFNIAGGAPLHWAAILATFQPNVSFSGEEEYQVVTPFFIPDTMVTIW
jgi:hypothetical protein